MVGVAASVPRWSEMRPTHHHAQAALPLPAIVPLSSGLIWEGAGHVFVVGGVDAVADEQVPIAAVDADHRGVAEAAASEVRV